MNHRLLALAVLLCVPLVAAAQDQPQSAPSTYVGEDGKLYWNKALPVYVFLSTSPTGQNAEALREERSQAAAQPYYLDTEGTNWIRSRWATDPETGEPISPQREMLWPVEADGLPPVTKAETSFAGRYTVNGRTYVSGDFSVSLSATDKGSGVKQIYFSRGDTWQPYAAPVTFGQEGEATLQFYAVDHVGNVESSDHGEDGGKNFMNFLVDKTPPSSALRIEGPKEGNVVGPTSKLVLSGEDSGAGLAKIFYTFDAGDRKTYSAPVSLSVLGEGDHQVQYQSVDQVANEEKPQAYQLFVDRTAPEVTMKVQGEQFKDDRGLYVAPSSRVAFSATDNKAGVASIHTSLDRAGYVDYTDPISAGLSAGLHTFSFYAVDKVENKSTSQTEAFIVDDQKPVISWTTDGPKYERNDTLFVRDITTFTLSPADAGRYQSGVAVVEYSFGDGGAIGFSEPFTIPGEGAKDLEITVTDQVGNMAEETSRVYLDNTAPTIIQNYSVDPIGDKTVKGEKYKIYPLGTNIFLAATDNKVGTKQIYYSINGGAEAVFARPISGLRAGNYTIAVRALDYLENESTYSFQFSVE